MKKITLLLILLLLLVSAGKNSAQTLICNDLVYISLDENCAYTVQPDDILEGVIFSNCVVELDRVLPFGNGPWDGPLLGPADVGQTFQVRVRHVPSGNMCWGSLHVEDRLPPVLQCGGLSTVNLQAAGTVSVATADLSVIATDACSGFTLNPVTLQFDCTQLGVNIVQLTATDASGNTSTCEHSISVGNSAACQTCVSVCPPSVTVTYEEGNQTLLPAFQSNNPAAFEPFGNALFDVACSYVDSTYAIDYHVGTAGQSWFQRLWQWTDGAGQVSSCEQNILFPATHTVSIQGQVFFDANDDCLFQAGEQPVNHYSLVVTTLPAGNVQSFLPAPDGTYSVDVVFGPQDVSAEIHLALPANVNAGCPTALNIPNSTAVPVYTFDIGLQSEGNCPSMQVDIGNLFLRRCGVNFFTVEYCNVGLDTAFGAYVTVNLDPAIGLLFAELPYTVTGPDDLYTFQIGDVAPFECGQIVLKAIVNCSVEIGQTLCNEAAIYPDTPCSGAWQGAKVDAAADCSGDSVSLVLTNKGIQGMAEPLDFIVIEDFIMYKEGAFQLGAGESVTVKVPANGATWRIEAQQAPGFPVPGPVAAAVEGCGGINIPGMLNVYGQSDEAINYDEYCGVVVASCDPNDKTAVPVGLGDEHIIRANQSIEYKIRFQNTGTDTAFQVVVVDTLSPLLDFRTLQLGASSHPYRLDIYPGGILHFVFQPIALPDSNVNEVDSHGYLYFKIAQQPDLADGTVIENTAAIYFDQNAPVFTNTAFHTIGYPVITIAPLAQAVQTVPVSCHGSADGAIYLAPSGGVEPYSFQWSDPALQGDTLTGLSAGVYYLTLTDSHGGKIVSSFELAAPAPITVQMDATPATGTENDGTASVMASGGSGAYTYLWSNGATTASISGLPPGIYTVVVRDVNACSQSSSVEVAQTFLPLMYTAQIIHPSCNGASDGAIHLLLSGGLTPYTFLWSDPTLQGASVTGLAAGSYKVTISDENGSQLEDSFAVTEPAPLVLTLQSTPASGNQNDGTVSASASGGNGGYSFLWSNGATAPGISGLEAGNYTVTVTDANGCSQISSITVAQTVGTQEQSPLSRLQVWPNPAHDRLTLDLSRVLPDLLRLDMLGADGRVLRQWEVGDLQPLLTLDLENGPVNGLILLVLHGREGSVYARKIIVR